jgi:hypothetical protein
MVHRKIAGTQEYRVIPPIFRDSCCSAQNRRGQELGTGARTLEQGERVVEDDEVSLGEEPEEV